MCTAVPKLVCSGPRHGADSGSIALQVYDSLKQGGGLSSDVLEYFSIEVSATPTERSGGVPAGILRHECISASRRLRQTDAGRCVACVSPHVKSVHVIMRVTKASVLGQLVDAGR